MSVGSNKAYPRLSDTWPPSLLLWVWRNELEGRALSLSWKEHSHGAAKPEEDAVTCGPIITGWLGGRDS